MITSKRILDDISTFIFVEDQPARADVILIPGSAAPEVPELAAQLFRAGYAPLVLPTGKFSYKRERFEGPSSKQDVYSVSYETEWEFQRDVLLKNGVPQQAILREDKSTQTVENAFFSKKGIDEAGLTIHTAILCCKAYHARRALMTFAWAFPGVDFIVCSVETDGINRDNWPQTPSGRELILSEVSKCGSYFADVASIWSEGI